MAKDSPLEELRKAMEARAQVVDATAQQLKEKQQQDRDASK